jgi:hypothetical protein
VYDWDIICCLQITIGNSLPLVGRDSRDELGDQFVEYNPLTRQFTVREYNRRVTGGQYYFGLPNMFLNNKVSMHNLKSLTNNILKKKLGGIRETS